MDTADSQQPARLDPIDVVALGHVLTHAAHVGLPMPADAHVGASIARNQHGAAIRLDVANLVDLTEWARYLEQPIDTEPLTSSIDHHCVEGEILELPIRVLTTVTYDPAVLASAHAVSKLVRELTETQPVPYVVADRDDR